MGSVCGCARVRAAPSCRLVAARAAKSCRPDTVGRNGRPVVLHPDARLRTAAEFAAVVRGGRRAATRRLVIHLLLSARAQPPRAGFVVSAKVGNSVVRHRVTRRLRPLLRGYLNTLPTGSALVVRALPSSAGASSAELATDLRAGLTSALRKATADGQRVPGTRSTGRSSDG